MICVSLDRCLERRLCLSFNTILLKSTPGCCILLYFHSVFSLFGRWWCYMYVLLIFMSIFNNSFLFTPFLFIFYFLFQINNLRLLNSFEDRRSRSLINLPAGPRIRLSAGGLNCWWVAVKSRDGVFSDPIL